MTSTNADITDGYGLYLGSPEVALNHDPRPVNRLAPIPTAEGVRANWTTDGLVVSFYAGGRVQVVRFDERAQTALRGAMGVRA